MTKRTLTTLACLWACAFATATLAGAPNTQASPALGPAASAAHPGMTPPVDATAILAQRHKKPKAPATGKHQLVDLNAASRDELMKLPGVSAADAERIIANRPYKVKTDLVNKSVLPTGPYLALRKLVIAMPPGQGGKAARPATAKPAKPAKTASAPKAAASAPPAKP